MKKSCIECGVTFERGVRSVRTTCTERCAAERKKRRDAARMRDSYVPRDARAKTKARRDAHRAVACDAKDVPCMDCGVSYPCWVMDFDHRTDEVKLFNVSSGMLRPIGEILAEIAKCDVVCANCHRARTHDRGH